MVLVLSQFFAPALAKRIHARFLVLEYEMQSNPVSAWINISSFWSEAKNKNNEFNDPVISKYIAIYHLWWVTGILAMIGVFFGW